MPSDASKDDVARFFALRGVVRQSIGDATGAGRDFETALSIWPSTENPALVPLRRYYREAGDAKALEALDARLKRPRS
jgi:lipoprotein NlpI